MCWYCIVSSCVMCCKSHILFELLQVHRAVQVIDHVCTTAASAFSPTCVLCYIVFFTCCIVFSLLPAQCVVRVSPILCLRYCQCSSAVCVSPVLCLHYCQCSMLWVSPVLCLHYCQCSVLCEDYNKCFVVFVQCTASLVCRAEATISPVIIFILRFFIFTHSH